MLSRIAHTFRKQVRANSRLFKAVAFGTAITAALTAVSTSSNHDESSCNDEDQQPRPRHQSSILPVAHAYSIAVDQIINNLHNKRPKSEQDWQPTYDTDFRSPLTRLSADPGQNQYDVLVIGGGKLGSSIALDAVSRGLRVCLVEREDFGSGATTARGRHILDGYGVFAVDGPLQVIRNRSKILRAMEQRIELWHVAPHLLREQQYIVPIFNPLQRLNVQSAVALASLLAGEDLEVRSHQWVNKYNMTIRFPHILDMLNVYGGVQWHEAAFDQSRLATCIALTALGQGATIVNHTTVMSLEKQDGKISGATVRDELTGQKFQVSARVVINATGPNADNIRRMDDAACLPIIGQLYQNVFLSLPQYYSTANAAEILQRKASSKISTVPWQYRNVALVSRLDSEDVASSKATRPSDSQIQSLIQEVVRDHDTPLGRIDVLSAWFGDCRFDILQSGLRTASQSKDCVIEISPSNLITAIGSEWATVRSAAKDVVDTVSSQGLLGQQLLPSGTRHIMLQGANNFYHKIYTVVHRGLGIGSETSINLKLAYGDRAEEIARIMFDHPLLSRRLGKNLITTEAEIIYICRNEYVQTAIDVVARRTRMMFMDREESIAAVPRVVALMTAVFGWGKIRQQHEISATIEYIKQNTS